MLTDFGLKLNVDENVQIIRLFLTTRLSNSLRYVAVSRISVEVSVICRGNGASPEESFPWDGLWSSSDHHRKPSERYATRMIVV